MSRKKVEELFATPGALQPLPGATSPQDYEQAIIGKAREAFAQATPEDQAKHPLNIPYLKQQAHRLYRHLHGGVSAEVAPPEGAA
jgi:hypothetical protein